MAKENWPRSQERDFPIMNNRPSLLESMNEYFIIIHHSEICLGNYQCHVTSENHHLSLRTPKPLSLINRTPKQDILLSKVSDAQDPVIWDISTTGNHSGCVNSALMD
jgi:hypothetical protein